jgi:hypothetical protein
VTIEEYKAEIIQVETLEAREIFTQKNFFHGNPFVFEGREHEYYDFRKRIANNFNIAYNEVLIVGSSKFGFSPYKLTEFSLESDIDVVLINERLFEKYFNLISDYQYNIRRQIIRLNESQLKNYYKFIRYFVMGWMRPDLLPQNTIEFQELKQEWDDFFLTVSYNKSEVGNYKVKAGLFKNQHYAEKYYRFSVEQIQIKIKAI